MDTEHDILLQKLEHNRELLIDIKEELTKKITLMELAQQKLKYTMYIGFVVLTLTFGKPELAQLVHLL